MTGQILLVESDVVLGAVLEEVLRQNGYEVNFVRTLTGQVDRIHSVSAVILDVDTTSADREVARLGVLQPCSESLSIVLMGVQVPKDLHQHLRPCFSRQQAMHLVWVQKPFRNEKLLAAVRQAQESSFAATGKRNVNHGAL